MMREIVLLENYQVLKSEKRSYPTLSQDPNCEKDKDELLND